MRGGGLRRSQKGSQMMLVSNSLHKSCIVHVFRQTPRKLAEVEAELQVEASLIYLFF